MVRIGGFMDILERSLAAAEAMLQGITPEEFEKEYLSIRNGVGPLAKEFITDSGKINHFPSESFNFKYIEINFHSLIEDHRMKRLHKSNLPQNGNSNFHQCGSYDYSEAA